MFTISCDSHLNSSHENLKKYCVKCFKNVNSNLKTKYINSLIDDIISNYYYANSFHNFLHAFEVFQATYQIQKCNKKLSAVERTLLLITALCHDLNHIGQSNTKLKSCKLIKKRSYSSEGEDIISLYNGALKHSKSYDSIFDCENNSSINEIIHVHQTKMLIHKHVKSIFNNESAMFIKLINNRINSLILSTDLQLHCKYMRIIASKPNDTMVQMIAILKMADLSHTCRPFHVHLYWVYKHISENKYMCYDLPFIAKDTLNFMKIFVEPLLSVIEKYGITKTLKKNYQQNQEQWSKYL
jgi:hypothetical protein|uniref:PDEase domain-containing protein n=1 Tax=viral metagenome TaxID=1070528 RepID=A0A6C0BQM3_9ZZZZ